jgi:hypothetical protein
MKYALGNMLNGAGGFNQDGLSLDLQFATDKTLTARKGPTPVFTRATTGTFIGSNGLIQSAAVDAARFDHDPITPFTCNGLLIEESRSNLQRNSAAFNLWGITGITVTANQTTAPDGTSTADTITETATPSTHFVSDANAPVTSGTNYTLSVFAKKGAGATAPNLIQIAGSSAAIGNTKYATFNIQNGSVNSFSGGTASIKSYPNGWYRLMFTVTAIATQNTAIIIGFVGALPAQRLPSYLGVITSDVYLWGAQIEAGSFATSYIPTGASALTRSADVCSISGSSFTGMYNQAEGAMLVNAFTPALGIRNIVSCSAPLDKEITLLTNVSAAELEVIDGVSQVDISSGAPTSPNTAFKLACAYKLNDFAVTKNGVAPQTDASGTVPTVDSMIVGAGPGGNTMCGCISSLRYYRKRLSDAKLQSLTA